MKNHFPFQNHNIQKQNILRPSLLLKFYLTFHFVKLQEDEQAKKFSFHFQHLLLKKLNIQIHLNLQFVNEFEFFHQFLLQVNNHNQYLNLLKKMKVEYGHYNLLYKKLFHHHVKLNQMNFVKLYQVQLHLVLIIFFVQENLNQKPTKTDKNRFHQLLKMHQKPKTKLFRHQNF